jgi:hypothetical protein
MVALSFTCRLRIGDGQTTSNANMHASPAQHVRHQLSWMALCYFIGISPILTRVGALQQQRVPSPAVTLRTHRTMGANVCCATILISVLTLAAAPALTEALASTYEGTRLPPLLLSPSRAALPQ